MNRRLNYLAEHPELHLARKGHGNVIPTVKVRWWKRMVSQIIVQGNVSSAEVGW